MGGHAEALVEGNGAGRILRIDPEPHLVVTALRQLGEGLAQERPRDAAAAPSGNHSDGLDVPLSLERQRHDVPD